MICLWPLFSALGVGVAPAVAPAVATAVGVAPTVGVAPAVAPTVGVGVGIGITINIGVGIGIVIDSYIRRPHCMITQRQDTDSTRGRACRRHMHTV